jgi:hypothetical protein
MSVSLARFQFQLRRGYYSVLRFTSKTVKETSYIGTCGIMTCPIVTVPSPIHDFAQVARRLFLQLPLPLVGPVVIATRGRMSHCTNISVSAPRTGHK